MAARSNRQFDEVFQHVPELGRYQVLFYLGTSLLIIPLALQIAMLVFAAGVPTFHCSTTNSTCPPNKCCENCTEYSFGGPFTSTVSEWRLICDRAHLGATSQAMFLAGLLVGSLLSGMVSDAFGRRRCMFISNAIMVIFAAGSSFSDCLSMFVFLRFGVGVAVAGLMLTEYVYILELVGPTKRTMAGKVSDFFWVIGACVTCLLGYLIRDWRLLLLVGSLPSVTFFLFWRVFPESARWLVLHGRIDEAHAVLMKFAGHKTVDSDALRQLLEDIHEDQREKENGAENAAERTYTPLDMLRTKKLRRRTLIVCFNWFVIAMVFFGFILYVVTLSGNIYLNVFILSIIDIVHTPISWFLLQRFGRRVPHCMFMLLGGSTCMMALAVPKGYPTLVTVISMIGKFCASAAFSTIYLYTSELYPTAIRNIALGTASMIARMGGIIAPYIVMLAQLPHLSVTLPVVIFGVLSLAAGILSLWLPETLFANMHQTIEETEATREEYGIPCCTREPLTAYDVAAQDEIEMKAAI